MTLPGFTSNHTEQSRGWVIFFAIESCLVGPSSSPRRWKPACLCLRQARCCPAFLLLYLPHSALWNLSSSSWVLLSDQAILPGGHCLKGLRSPGPQPERLVAFCPRTRAAAPFPTVWPQGTGSGYPGRLLDWDSPSPNSGE